MSTTLKRAALISLWSVLPKAAKGAIYRAHRHNVEKRLACGKLFN